MKEEIVLLQEKRRELQLQLEGKKRIQKEKEEIQKLETEIKKITQKKEEKQIKELKNLEIPSKIVETLISSEILYITLGVIGLILMVLTKLRTTGVTLILIAVAIGVLTGKIGLTKSER